MARSSIFPQYSIVDIWSADSIPCGASRIPLVRQTQTPIITSIHAPKCSRLMRHHVGRSRRLDYLAGAEPREQGLGGGCSC
jgi:hypothetical protein